MQEREKNTIWNAIYCKPRQEKKVSKLLSIMHIDHYLPLIKVRKKWSDRKKIVDEPLIRPYIFIQYDFNVCNNTLSDKIINTDGVICFVKYKGLYAKIFDSEINNIKLLLGEITIDEEQFKEIKLGAEVEIARGPLSGQRGIVINDSKKEVQLTIESVGFQLNIKVDKGNIELIKSKII